MSIYDEMLDDPSMIPDTETVNPNPPNPEDFQEQGETGDLQPIGPNTQATEQLETPTGANIVQPQVLPDLTNPEVKQQMKDDQSIWWDMPRGEEKDTAKKQWIEKYWGSEKKYNDQFSLYGSSNPLEVIGDTMQTLAAFGEGGPGYFSDLIGLLPGLAGVDNAYDRYTAEMFDNPNMEAVRNVSKIVIPSVISGNVITGLTNKAAAAGMIGRLQQFGIGLSLNTIVDSAIVSLADQSSDKNHFQWAYDNNFLNLFGRDQLLEVPDIFLKGDKYSPYLNRFSAAMADLPFSFIGNLIGWSIAMKANPKAAVMGWMEPLDEAAVSYKNSRVLSVADSENIKEMDRLQTLLQSGKLSKVDEAEAIDRLILLEESTGKLDDIDNALRIDEELIDSEKNLSGIRKISENGGEVPTNKIDGDISPDSANSGKITPAPGNVARNQED